MKKILLSFPLLLLTFFSYSFESTIENKLEQTLAQHKGKVIYLDFWASWCGPCRKSFPWMNAMQAKYQTQAFTVLSINLDHRKDLATNFLLTSPANFPIIYDPKGKLAKKFKIKGMPSSYLINKAGELVSAHVGFTKRKQMEYEAEIKTLLAE